MKKWLGGGLALGLAALGSVALAGTSWAGAPKTITVNPATLVQGTTAVVSSDPGSGCLDPETSEPGIVEFDVTFQETGGVGGILAPEDVTNADGSWSIEIVGTDPDTGEVSSPGVYIIDAFCFSDDAGSEDPPLFEYESAFLTVTVAPTPTTEPPAEPAPATPRPQNRRPTG